jgi:hypothetical protein
VFVAGEKSRNIVVISPDGNSAKEKGGISDNVFPSLEIYEY